MSTPSPYLRSPDYFRPDFIDAVMAVVPTEVQDKVRKHPLTDEQAGVLYALAEHGHGGFTWSNRSTTERILDALVTKGLAIRHEQKDRYDRVRPFWKPLAEVRQVFIAREQDREAALHARWDAEAKARREADLEALGRSKRLADTLGKALSLLALEQQDPIHGEHCRVTDEALTAARAHVAAMVEQNNRTIDRLAVKA